MLKRYLPTKWIGGKTIGTADVMNNIEEGINNVNDDLCEPSSSGDLLNENVNSFKVGTGTVEGIKKDYTEQVHQSVITLDNIQGKTVKINNDLVSSNLSRIYSSNTPIINDFEVESDGYYLNWATNELVARENYYVTKKVPVEPNTDYIFSFINNNICFYDIDGNFIKVDTVPGREIKTNTGLGNSTFIYTTPPNAYWVKISAFKNAVHPPRITKFIDYIDYDIELRSLPNGVCDEIKDGELINNVGVYNVPYDADWVYDGNVQSSGDYTTAVWYLKLPNISKINDNVNSCYAICNDSKLTETTSWSILKNRYDVGIALTSGNVVVVRISSNISTKEQLNSYLQSVGGLTIYYPINKIVSPINVSILANSNDTISIDTPIPLTCTHKVSLNTKSQIEELQEVVQKEKKSLWQKLKELTDVKFELNENGYFKLPSILGGLTIQWVSNTVTGNSYKSFGLPIPFDNNVLYYIGTLTGEVPGNSVVTFGDVSKSGFKAKHTVNNNTLTFKAFFIGY